MEKAGLIKLDAFNNKTSQHNVVFFFSKKYILTKKPYILTISVKETQNDDSEMLINNNLTDSSNWKKLFSGKNH